MPRKLALCVHFHCAVCGLVLILSQELAVAADQWTAALHVVVTQLPHVKREGNISLARCCTYNSKRCCCVTLDVSSRWAGPYRTSLQTAQCQVAAYASASTSLLQRSARAQVRPSRRAARGCKAAICANHVQLGATYNTVFVALRQAQAANCLRYLGRHLRAPGATLRALHRQLFRRNARGPVDRALSAGEESIGVAP